MIKSFFLISLLFLNAKPGFTWGKTGHRVVGEIAQRNLNDETIAEIRKLLGQQSLAQVSNWADNIRDEPRWQNSFSWHYVDIPKGLNYEDLPADDHVDIVDAILRLENELSSPEFSHEQRTIALKWLVHLVGDIHQPLHAGIPGDHGGNLVEVSWFSKKTNLHRVWDEDCIDNELLAFTEYADFLNQLPGESIKDLQSANIFQWIRESRSYLDLAYEIGDKNLSYPYRAKILPVIEKRMLEAGIRLAGLLNLAMEKFIEASAKN